MPWQRPLTFFLPETKERFEAGLREADFLEQQAASLLSRQANQVQHELNRREAEGLRGQAVQLKSFEGQNRLIESLRQEERQKIAREGIFVYEKKYHRKDMHLRSQTRVIRWHDGRLFVCRLSQNEIWQRTTHKRHVAGMDGHMYETDVTEPVNTGEFGPLQLMSVTEGLSALSPEELREVEPFL